MDQDQAKTITSEVGLDIGKNQFDPGGLEETGRKEEDKDVKELARETERRSRTKAGRWKYQAPMERIAKAYRRSCLQVNPQLNLMELEAEEEGRKEKLQLLVSTIRLGSQVGDSGTYIQVILAPANYIANSRFPYAISWNYATMKRETNYLLNETGARIIENLPSVFLSVTESMEHAILPYVTEARKWMNQLMKLMDYCEYTWLPQMTLY